MEGVTVIQVGSDHCMDLCSQVPGGQVGNQLPDQLEMVIGQSGRGRDLGLHGKRGIQITPKYFTLCTGTKGGLLCVRSLIPNSRPTQLIYRTSVFAGFSFR